jgi:uncharacterized membrane protein YfcA
MGVGILVPLGLAAGALTTIAGLGGGQLLVLALAALFGPRLALATSAPALFAGNLHRYGLFRAHVERRIARRFAAGALPGSILGGLVAVGLPGWLIQTLLVGTTGLAIARKLGHLEWKPRTSAFGPAGFAIGAVCATSSGAGLLLAPLLLSTGLSGAPYVATSSFCAASLHLGRLVGYGLGGLMSRATLERSLVLGVAILTGNLVGDRLRRHLGARATSWIEHGTLVTCVVLAVVSAARR